MDKLLIVFSQKYKDDVKELYGKRTDDVLYAMHLEIVLQDLLGYDKYLELCRHAIKESYKA